MCLFSLAKIEADLDREISSPPSEALFLQFITKLPSEHRNDLGGWSDLRETLEQIGFKPEKSDPLIRAIIQGYQDDGEVAWNGVAVHLFWRPLCRIHRGLLGRDESHILFAEIHWRFLAALSRFDLSRRTNHLGKKLLNDTWSDTRRSYRNFHGQHVQFLEDEIDEDPCLRTTSHYWDRREIESAIDRHWAIERLRLLVRDGSLTRTDFQILLGCHLYSRSISEMADNLCISYGVAKKRRQRAEKKLQKNAPHLSPNDPDSPLYPIERSTRKEADNVRKL